nr:hypothetical protein [Demequina litorisediminis]
MTAEEYEAIKAKALAK